MAAFSLGAPSQDRRGHVHAARAGVASGGACRRPRDAPPLHPRPSLPPHGRAGHAVPAGVRGGGTDAAADLAQRGGRGPRAARPGVRGVAARDPRGAVRGGAGAERVAGTAAGTRGAAADAGPAPEAVREAAGAVGGVLLAAPHGRSAVARHGGRGGRAGRAGARHGRGRRERAAPRRGGGHLHRAAAPARRGGAAADGGGRAAAHALQPERAAHVPRGARAAREPRGGHRGRAGRCARHPVLRARTAGDGARRDDRAGAVRGSAGGGAAAQPRLPGHPLRVELRERADARRGRAADPAGAVHAGRTAGVPGVRAVLLRPDRRPGEHQRSRAARGGGGPKAVRGARRARGRARRARRA